MAQQAKPSQEPLVLKLPHPYLTTYTISNVAPSGQPTSYQIQLIPSTSTGKEVAPPTVLHNEAISFTDIATLDGDAVPPTRDNSSWARARRSPYLTVSWNQDRPSVPQLWLVAYALVSLHPLVESFRVVLSGKDSTSLAQELYGTGLFHPHPKASNPTAPQDGHLLLRATFWQGAGSPFGVRPVWAPHLDASGQPITRRYPPFPYQNAPSTQWPAVPRHTTHPVREPKPQPGSIVYSRWLPHLKEHFSMTALDYTNDEHLRLFNKWQNDPRVAAGWNETGTLDQHREYLRKLHEDPHVLTMLAAFDDIFFGYFEVYWAMEDHMGAHYQSSPYDRGRHLLVGDVRFRGPHRVSVWWCNVMHYMFLDEPRTWNIVGEPAVTSSTVLAYDFATGLHVEKIMDLPHKRSALMMVNREKFFTLNSFVWDGERRVRPSLDLGAKL
ncbi:aerobactin siderophore biosynthesis protein iucB [Pyrenophora tritici-repentis]|uniref:Aerobactin siderophore biosynthesis protein iucB n=2 Tax=Pyrenophora tritici-repentis TaxID=45151 RepID=A0A2W1F882_9PLEO|nr:aerobactin siderophore biosynthesis protein iucB [Pyrenophora tritici-repentis Pt-1C-BFP]KAA8626365.1 Aerobactin siderophore biosynthesis protein iucB [Pyrenophora tritici-repentis]EDU41117.1 aerobactin siderophore biosynthesis protein iucB [Pyrenophora tritici-repentis Pt-1C-BFP]KAF7454783.1 Aerobactin siderophore biosynthesis protein iucB [Pyrenophora tritici-repentis]KAF7577915.1 aerobactin siderophore biosynthesis protein iucB [Pyrenophora tritici-repentis]KAG9388544.1 Aerobactin sidero